MTAIPVSGTDSGLPERLLAMVRLAVRLPAAAGVKVTLMEQFAPANTLPRQLASIPVNSEAFAPLNAILVMLSVLD